MSDLYLVLRHRLSDVNDWVDLGTTTLLTARKRQGLSYEAMGRQLNVASKTYERYEKRGRIPRQMLVKVADILDLEIDQPTRERITLPAEPGLAEEVRALRTQLERLIERLDPQDAARES